MLNTITLMGRLTADPEQQQISGHDFVKIDLAVTRNYKNANGEYEADFIRCVAWNNNAKLMCRLSKGELVVVRGSLQIRKYTTKTNESRSIAEVVVDEIEFTSTKKEQKQDDFVELSPEDAGDLPF